MEPIRLHQFSVGGHVSQQKRDKGKVHDVGEVLIDSGKAPGIVRTIVGRQENPDQEDSGARSPGTANHRDKILAEDPERCATEPIIGPKLEDQDLRMESPEQLWQPDAPTARSLATDAGIDDTAVPVVV